MHLHIICIPCVYINALSVHIIHIHIYNRYIVNILYVHNIYTYIIDIYVNMLYTYIYSLHIAILFLIFIKFCTYRSSHIKYINTFSFWHSHHWFHSLIHLSHARIWWLILYVNLKLKDAQMVDKTVFLGVFVRVFGEEISIWIRGGVRKITLSNAGGLIHWGPE